MEKRSYLGLMLMVMFVVSAFAGSSARGSIPVTFRVDMAVQIFQKNFKPGTDQLSVRGSFNDWQEGIFAMTDVDGDSIYTVIVNLDNSTAGDSIAFEYVYSHGGRLVSESIPDRKFLVPPAGGSVALDFFEGDSTYSAGAPIFPVGSNSLIGSEFWIEVKVGESDNPVTDLFGVAFVLNFTPTSFIDLVQPTASNVLAGDFIGTDALIFPTLDEATGTLNVGISRRFPQPGVNGAGAVMKAKFVSLSNTPRNTRAEFFITGLSANNSTGSPMPLNPSALSVKITSCPSVSGINPTTGPIGGSVAITGTGFSGVTAVKFSNNLTAAFTINSDTQITTTVPNGAVTGPITISKSGCSDVQTQAFTLISCPSVDSINPTSGIVGTQVIITGANLTEVSAVKFASNVSAAFTVNNATQITTNVPSGAVTGPITVSKNGCDDVQTTAFTVITCPTVTGINPTSGPVGAPVIITGTNFTEVTAVEFSNNVTAGFIINNDTQITTSVPAGAVTGPITLSKSGCNDVQTPAFTVTQPRVVRLAKRSSVGGKVSIAVELESQGDENALGFSLNFDAAALKDPVASLGSGAVNAALNTNATQAGLGRFGVLVALPAGQAFTSGIQELEMISFSVVPSFGNDSTSISFGDQPIAREVASVQGALLETTWKGVSVEVTSGFEGDVAPRPFGDNSGSITLADWQQAGRFVARLDTPAVDITEFQRADCGPKTCGDGKLSIVDWVQTGRYAAGLDNTVTACGPIAPVNSQLVNAPSREALARVVRIAETQFLAGKVNELGIELEAQGDENAIGFTIAFDTAVMSFEEVSVINGATGTAHVVNSNQKNDGRVAIALALPAGKTLPAGMHGIVTLAFNVKATASGTTSMSFVAEPIAGEIVSAEANVLSTEWIAAEILVGTNSVQEKAGKIPTSFELGQNYPNPFNPTTTIEFAVPRSVKVELKIFDLLGAEVATLAEGNYAAGRYEVQWNASGQQSGVYFYRLQAGEFVHTRKLVLMK